MVVKSVFKNEQHGFVSDCRPTPEPEVVESIQVPVQETPQQAEAVQGASTSTEEPQGGG